MSQPDKGLHQKTRIINILVFLFAIALAVASFRWQVIESADFKSIAEGRVFQSELNSLRGSIHSSDGSTLAYSEPRFDMYLWMKDLEFFEDKGSQTRQELIDKTAPILELEPDELEGLIDEYSIEKGLLWFRIGESLDADQWQALKDLRTEKNPNRSLRGFIFQYTSERVYPEGELASHIIGLTNKERDIISGAGGLEQSWDGDLTPRKGLLIKENDAIGQAVGSALIPTIEPKPGSSIYTSIDKKLQSIVEDKNKEFAERFNAKSTNTIVMDPKTGEIMALANYPSYNPNTRESDDPSVFTNKAISIPYEVGSVGKIFTLAAGLDLGVFDTDTIILPEGHNGCEFIAYELGELCTWNKKAIGPMPAWECFVRSDNICFWEMLKMIKDHDVMYEYLHNFGVGQKTGIDIAGESNGYVKNPQVAAWNIGDEAAYSYGHGYSVNALQVISAVSAIPNKGVRMQPHVVDRVVKGDGQEVEMTPQPLNGGDTVISPETAEVVGQIMHQTFLNDIRDYETWYHHLENYNIGMKSGTALIANESGYTSDVNTTQVGFDMNPERTFIMLVHIEEPEGATVVVL